MQPTAIQESSVGSMQAFNERHRRCDASECLCPGGRELAEEEGPWQLLLCCSCAAEGTHRCCSFVKHTTTSRECKSCAGLGTACSASSDLAGPSTASRAELGPSHGSSTPEASSSSSASQLPSGPSSSSAQLKSDSRSGHAGPMRTRHRSRLQHRAPKPYSRPRKHQESSHVTAPCAESSTPSQAVLDPSHDCPALGTSSPSTASQAGSGPSHGSPAALTVQRHGRVLPGSVSPGEGHPQPRSRGPCPWPREAGPARLCPSARAPRRGPPGPQRVSRQRGLRRALAWPSRRSVARRRRRRRGWAGGECAAVGPGPPRGPRL
ncbi:pineapple eye protein-like [Falco cherrug]|uniref:pineapple eye protein-like n=1 Tax=Falco cherrug TaxID=345164 RepID=UPI00247892D7|nr:pineapple eye protein-like [Falco cherrug]